MHIKKEKTKTNIIGNALKNALKIENHFLDFGE